LADCSWTRLAFLLFALTILLALTQLQSPSDDPQPLASKPPDRATASENPPPPEGEPREPTQSTQHEGATRTTLLDHDERNNRNGASADASDGANPGPPVFYRPAPASSASGGKSGSDPVCRNLEGFPSDRRIAFPLPREYLDSYEDTWGAPRPQGGLEGTDLMAPIGTAEYAMTDGTIVPVAGANENGWNSLGGYAVMLKAAKSVGPIKQGDLFYYAHLNHESALEIGTRVQVGQTVGYVGDTGQGPEVTRGLFPPHLHFGWYDATGARSTTSGVMNPYPLLEWLRTNGGAITGGSDARYCETLRTGGPVPSTGESRWATIQSPGVSPDLDTGSNGPILAVENPERQLDHASETAPAQQSKPAPKAAPRDAPERRVSPKPQTPSDERTSGTEGTQDRSDAAHPTPGEEPPADEESNDHRDKEQNATKDEEEDQGEAPEKAELEDPQPPDEPTSPDEHQYAPETGGESDLE
jgi:murein DD-endopeptidase MepM/ murein hydrolase activator NlpD